MVGLWYVNVTVTSDYRSVWGATFVSKHLLHKQWWDAIAQTPVPDADKQEKATQTVLERAEVLSAQWAGAWEGFIHCMQSFLNGSLTRLLDPNTTLRGKIVEFVGRGDFGLASGQKPDGTYERVWFEEPVSPDEVAFMPWVFCSPRTRRRR